MTTNIKQIRNIGIIAHVDHGKTTLVDQLLRQSGTFDSRREPMVRVMDSNDLERERGITILSKNTAIRWGEYRINIVDTPGHADFGGEVERVLSMVDSVLLLVDAVEGPMPQTRFVTEKAFAMGFKPIVVVNKIDRPGARPEWVIERTFDLFDNLGASDEQLDFPVVYASALEGYSGYEPEVRNGDMTPIFETITQRVSPPAVDPDGPFQMRVTTLDYSSYVGVIGIGRIERGRCRPGMNVAVVDREGQVRSAKLLQVLGFLGLDRLEVKEACAGDIVAISGVSGLAIAETVCDPAHADALPILSVDEPTISMTFQVNDSPFAGLEGKYMTSRQVRERLMREASHNVALRVEDTEDAEKFKVSGRGELHLAILIENMRREGFELAVSRPQVIVHEENGVATEPFEDLVIDVEERHQGAIMERLGESRADLKNMLRDGLGRVRLDFLIPARGLIGFQSEFRTLTAGTGLMHHVFSCYAPRGAGRIAPRKNGVLISNGRGKSPAYAQFNLQDHGRLFIAPGEEIYEGQIVGMHVRNKDMTVNALRGKQLTNVRAAGKDDAVLLTPPTRLSLEQALEFIEEDELVEVTPAAIRLRKKNLTEVDRRRASRAQK